MPYNLDPDDPTPTPTGLTLPYSNANLKDWNVVTPKGIAWSLGSSYAKASGYNSSDKTYSETETWLISPAIALNSTEGVIVDVDHVIRYSKSAADLANHKLLITEKFDGDPANSTWTELDYTPVESPTQTWDFYAAKTMQIPEAFLGKTVYFAFKFMCGTSNSTTWELKNFSVKEGKASDNPDTPSGKASGDGTLQNPYNPTAANKLASSLGWKTTTEYETSDNVYVKGKISKINETYTASGNNGNATFFISEDGTEESDQFQCYRILYLGNKQYTSGTDIKVGDDVVIYGKLMNYRGNTPETVAKGAYLYSLNGNTEGGGDDTGGGDTGGGTEVSLTNPGFETWANDLPTGWKSASTASSATLVQSTDAHTGSYSCTIKGDEGNNKRLASQEMTLAAGDYTLTFWVKPTTEDAVQVRPGYVPVTDGTAGSYKYGDYVTLTSGWQQVTYTFSLTAETTICLVVMNPKKSNYSSGKDVLVDDFVLTKK